MVKNLCSQILIFTTSMIMIVGCSTMFNSGSQSFMARSSNGHEGVEVEVKGSGGTYNAKLPTTVIESPSTFAPLEIRVTDKCYNQTSSRARWTVTPSYWANILNIWGFGIDALTGSMWKYDSNFAIPTEKNNLCK